MGKANKFLEWIRTRMSVSVDRFVGNKGAQKQKQKTEKISQERAEPLDHKFALRHDRRFPAWPHDAIDKMFKDCRVVPILVMGFAWE